MAATGKLKPTDQVRRADVETARPASAIKGLFEPVEAPMKIPPPVQPRHAAFIEVRIVTDLGKGKTLFTTEEYELGQGVGPVMKSAFDGEG